MTAADGMIVDGRRKQVLMVATCEEFRELSSIK